MANSQFINPAAPNGISSIITITGMLDATATTIFTISCPNISCAAIIHVEAIGSLGAGGAVGAFESSIAASFDIAVSRTAGVQAISAVASLYGSTGSATSAGADTAAIARSVNSWGGGVTAVNTQVVLMTVTKGAGSSTGHQVMLLVTVVNTNPNNPITIG